MNIALFLKHPSRILEGFKKYRSIINTVRFNFHYLPFGQAIRLPIMLYKPDLVSLKGKVVIDSPVIRRGMIELGFRHVSLYPNTGIMWENKGGTIVFHGSCHIGNDSYLSFGQNTTVEFGNKFVATAGLKLVSTEGISFGECTSLGWGCLFMDNNLHPIYNINKKEYNSSCGKITIGPYNWFATGCKVMHSVETPERCIFAMNTIVAKNTPAKPYCVMGGSPVAVLSENVMRTDMDDCD